HQRGVQGQGDREREQDLHGDGHGPVAEDRQQGEQRAEAHEHHEERQHLEVIEFEEAHYLIRSPALDMTFVAYSPITRIIQGASSTRMSTTAIILGMKVSVASLIWVIAWRTLTTMPTTIAAISIGAARYTVVRIA